MNELPNEVLISIFHRVKDQNILRNAITVCKRWYEIITGKTFWIQYHQFWNNALPLKLFDYDFPWQYYANIRHGHRFERNLLSNGKDEVLPTLKKIVEADNNMVHSLTYGWKWIYTGEDVVFKNIQKLDLYDIFQEKSLFKSDYEVTITIKEYYDWRGRTDHNVCLKLVLESNGDEFPRRFLWESEGQNWTKVVLTKKVSLKKWRYLKFIQEFRFGDLLTFYPTFPFGLDRPRATMKISFPMHQEQEQEQDQEQDQDQIHHFEKFDDEEITNRKRPRFVRRGLRTKKVPESDCESDIDESLDVDTHEYEFLDKNGEFAFDAEPDDYESDVYQTSSDEN